MNKYFGDKWSVNLADAKVATPVGAVCIWCGEAFVEGDSGIIYVPGLPEMMHFECNWRQMIGAASGVGSSCRFRETDHE